MHYGRVILYVILCGDSLLTSEHVEIATDASSTGMEAYMYFQSVYTCILESASFHPFSEISIYRG